MGLKDQLQNDMKTALREGDKEKRRILSMLSAAIKQVEIDEQKTLDDDGVQNVLMKQAKQRRESIADYEQAGRPEQAAEEAYELAVIEAYLPKMMSREELQAVARGVIADVGAADVKAMGQVMGRVMSLVKGQADGRLVNEVVRELLQG